MRPKSNIKSIKYMKNYCFETGSHVLQKTVLELT